MNFGVKDASEMNIPVPKSWLILAKILQRVGKSVFQIKLNLVK